ncbi:MAG: hypothetical protein FDW93_04940 [Bergeyella sp.]|nr:hypothetical protein [Bergeyella sp.]
MHQYNNRNFFKLVLSLKKSDTLKILFPSIMGMAVYSFGIYYLEVVYLKLSKNSSVVNVSLVHSLIGFVLSLLLVFRTNTAYERWWEGRKLWGQLANDSRNLAVKLNALLAVEQDGQRQDRAFFWESLSSFPFSLSKHLSEKSTRMRLDEHFSGKRKESVKDYVPPVEIIKNMVRRLTEIHKKGIISGEELFFLDRQVSGFLDVCGGCERIKNTPIPISYSSFVKKFIMTYSLTLPVAYAINIGWIMVFITCFVFYVLMSLEIIAEEIEDPFNNDENDIPTEKIAQDISQSIETIFNT